MTSRNLIISDLHIPDQHRKSLELVYAFIKVYKPTTLHILGDFVNFPTISAWPQDPTYHISLTQEIKQALVILKKLVHTANCEVIWYEGNHENRLIRYLNSRASELTELDIEGERVISIQHLFGLKALGVSYVDEVYRNGVYYHHGELVRGKAGMTAHGNMDRTGVSAISGHVHRLALVYKNLYNRKIFGMETGCLCNYKPTPYYGAKIKDWQLGFGTIDVVDGRTYPRIYPIINNSLVYGDKIISYEK